ncbi:hypothetical protein NEIELOOT_01857 [Neisseria elongata subsp. glycolytica ATCC 29315]|uniref:Uncharacterized protein n=1 Tax=Neisseria elongata subsp. glycolytica ATCC 29315 TaxID=546263 RepID=D4DS14_NEIEG|nr:hypothetical protein NEIELOOT_01857 [Neisseria elongata subsp. glycolytica ATCC 29315]
MNPVVNSDKAAQQKGIPNRVFPLFSLFYGRPSENRFPDGLPFRMVAV